VQNYIIFVTFGNYLVAVVAIFCYYIGCAVDSLFDPPALIIVLVGSIRFAVLIYVSQTVLAVVVIFVCTVISQIAVFVIVILDLTALRANRGILV